MKILILGLENAGKSTIINYLKTNQITEPSPTQGYSVMQIEY